MKNFFVLPNGTLVNLDGIILVEHDMVQFAPDRFNHGIKVTWAGGFSKFFGGDDGLALLTEIGDRSGEDTEILLKRIPKQSGS